MATSSASGMSLQAGGVAGRVPLVREADHADAQRLHRRSPYAGTQSSVVRSSVTCVANPRDSEHRPAIGEPTARCGPIRARRARAPASGSPRRRRSGSARHRRGERGSGAARSGRGFRRGGCAAPARPPGPQPARSRSRRSAAVSSLAWRMMPAEPAISIDGAEVGVRPTRLDVGDRRRWRSAGSPARNRPTARCGL